MKHLPFLSGKDRCKKAQLLLSQLQITQNINSSQEDSDTYGGHMSPPAMKCFYNAIHELVNVVAKYLIHG
jgi:hypothetical protein